jgi:hypothetical protein
MVEKPRQKMRYDDAELSLIKNSFAGNEELLKVIRKVFLQLPLSAVDQAMLINLKNQTDLLKVIRKAYLPTLDGEAPFNQVVDLWLTVEIKGKELEEAVREIRAREKLLNYINQQLNVLEGVDVVGGIKLNDCINIGTKKSDKILINMIMRNTLIAHSEMQLNMFSVLSEMKNETLDETKQRIFKDGSK